MKRRFLAIALPLALCLAGLSGSAAGDDLVQIYGDALTSDPTLAAARANWAATQQALPQARAGLLPLVSLLATANEQDFNDNLHSDPAAEAPPAIRLGRLHGVGEPAAVPHAELDFLRPGEAAGRQSEYVLASVQQDLIVRVVQAYFDVLLAQFTIELTESQKAAVSENLAQASATSRSARRPSPTPTMRRPSTTRSPRRRSRCRTTSKTSLPSLRAIIGRTPKESEAGRTRATSPSCPCPTPSSRGSRRRSTRTTRSASPRRTSTSRRSKSTGSAPATIRRSIWSRASTRPTRARRRRRTSRPISRATRGSA